MPQPESHRFKNIAGVFFAITILTTGIISNKVIQLIDILIKAELIHPHAEIGQYQYLFVFNIVGTAFFILCSLARFYEHMIQNFSIVRRRQIELFLHYSYINMGYVFSLTLVLLAEVRFSGVYNWTLLSLANSISVVTSFLLFFVILKIYLWDEIKANAIVSEILKNTNLPF